MSSSVESWKAKDDILSQCSTDIGSWSPMLPDVRSSRNSEASLSRPSSATRISRPSSAAKLSRPSSRSSLCSVCSLPSITPPIDRQAQQHSEDTLAPKHLAKTSPSLTRFGNSASSPSLHRTGCQSDEVDRLSLRARQSEKMVTRRPRKDLPKMKSHEPHEEIQAQSRSRWAGAREEIVARRRSASVSGRTNENKTTSRPKLKRRHHVGFHEERQNEAFVTLVQSIVEANGFKTALQVMPPLLKDVILKNGLPAFPEQHIIAAADEVLRCDAAITFLHPLLDNAIVKAVFMILEVLCPRQDLNVNDVIGQILWRHRKNEAISSNKAFAKAADDLSWAVEDGAGKSGRTVEGMKEVFNELTSGREGGMSNREWCKVVTMIRKDDECRSQSMAISDTDVLFYLQTHTRGETTYDISYSKFKRLLLIWAEEMQLHPYHILNALSKHAEPTDELADEQ